MQALRGTPVQNWDWSRARGQCLREARRLLRHREDAEDAVQEALARVWRRRDACRTPDAPLPWILQIARNEAFRLLACRQRRQSHECCEPPAEGPPAEDPRLEEVFGTVAMAQSLAGLRPDERALLWLRYVEDLTQPEVAQVLDLPEGTVKVRLHRIRNRLRNTLKEEV